MTTDAPLSPSALPPERVDILQNAVVAPMVERRNLACGVFRADGSFCENSRTLVSASRFTGIPDPLPSDAIEDAGGRFLYAGIGRHHFGHFLMECIGRLWAMEDHHHDIDGILVTPMSEIDMEAVTRRRFLRFYNLLSFGRPLFLVERPARVDELILPSPAFGHMGWCRGTPRFRNFVRARLETGLKPEGPDRLYVSRSRLKAADQRVDQEDRIESLMKAAGYTIFHPQKHSMEEQCRRYMAARQIVGGDGSAFHLAPFVLQPGTRVGLIRRRYRKPVFDALAGQITAFADVRLTCLNALRPRQLAEAGKPAPLDFDKLHVQLAGAGFV